MSVIVVSEGVSSEAGFADVRNQRLSTIRYTLDFCFESNIDGISCSGLNAGIEGSCQTWHLIHCGFW